MSMPSPIQLFKRHSVPLVVFVMVAVSILLVPPVVLGEVTARTYALTAAVVILAVSSAAPYAVLVGLGTLPLLYAGVASFAAPQRAAKDLHPFSAVAATRHTVAGISYVLGAAAVGAIGIGVQIGMRSDSTAIPAVFQPSFLYLGGMLVAGAFVSLQLWRYDTSLSGLARRTVLGTVTLGILLALSPAVAFWVFNGAF
jgi:hypothetical protein